MPYKRRFEQVAAIDPLGITPPPGMRWSASSTGKIKGRLKAHRLDLVQALIANVIK